jgi:hypothetical protein
VRIHHRVGSLRSPVVHTSGDERRRVTTSDDERRRATTTNDDDGRRRATKSDDERRRSTTCGDARRQATTGDDERRRAATSDDERRPPTTRDDARRRATTSDDARDAQGVALPGGAGGRGWKLCQRTQGLGPPISAWELPARPESLQLGSGVQVGSGGFIRCAVAGPKETCL